jgi:hypothetical protein
MNYEFIGWCKEGTHDKVWGVILLAKDVPVSTAWHFHTNKYITFWGRRGHKLQTKLFSSSQFEAGEMCRKKVNKGYTRVNKERLDVVYPEFQSDLEKTAMWAMLKL